MNVLANDCYSASRGYTNPSIPSSFFDLSPHLPYVVPRRMSSVGMEKQVEENIWPTFESGSEPQVPLNLTTVRAAAMKQEKETESIPEVTCPEQNHVIGVSASGVLSPSRIYRRNSGSPAPDFASDAKNLSGMSIVQNTGPHLEYGSYYPRLPPGIGMTTPVGALQFVPSTAPPPPPLPSIVSRTTEASEWYRPLKRSTAFVALYLSVLL